MNTIQRLLLTLCLLLVSTAALAAPTRFWVVDGVGLLKPSEVTALGDREWSFAIHVLIGDYTTLAALETAAHDSVDAPDVVAVAIDPKQHRVVTRFGTDTRVKATDFDAISAAGNAHFRAGEAKLGVEAILIRAEASATSATGLTPAVPAVVESGASVGFLTGLVLVASILAGAIVLLVRSQRRERHEYEKVLDDTRGEASELRARNIEEGDWHAKMRDKMTPSGNPFDGNPFAASTKPEHVDTQTHPFRSPSVRAPLPPSEPLPPRRSRVSTPAAPPVAAPPVIMPMYMPTPVIVEARSAPAAAPAPASSGSSSSYGGSSSSYGSSSSSSDSGGSSSSYGGGSTDYGGGGGGGGFDSGGGGSSW